MPLAERFSPLRMMMSLRRPVMRMKPSASATARSPVRKKPSAVKAALSAGVEVADAELRAVRLDLALDAGGDRPSLLVDQARDRARHRAAVGAVQLLLAGRRGGPQVNIGHSVMP